MTNWHDSRETFWKKVIYAEEPRSVLRGEQRPGERHILAAKNSEPAIFNDAVVGRLRALFRNKAFGYDPQNIREHPDAVLAREQLLKMSELWGPFQYVEPLEPDPHCKVIPPSNR